MTTIIQQITADIEAECRKQDSLWAAYKAKVNPSQMERTKVTYEIGVSLHEEASLIELKASLE